VRDPATQRMLEAIRPGRIECVADPALFLEPAAASPSAGFDGWRIGLNLAFHDRIVSRDVLSRLDLLCGLARALSGIRPCRFVYFVHSDAERLLPRLLRRGGVPVEVVDADPREMVAAYRQLDLHICQMLHSSILATNAGVPTINLGYDVKNAGFFELIGMAEFSVPAATVQLPDLVDRARSLLARGDAVSLRLRQRKAALRSGMDAFLNRLVACVTTHPGRKAKRAGGESAR
jgi:polysaccharide pyruvyl transferase WcaK-like protein